jgi:DNA-binding NarL/FixJ family response regulator
MTVRVVVVDDNDLLRAGLVTVLTSDPDVEVVGEAVDGPAAVLVCGRTSPDVVLMDVEMPGGDGLAATEALGSQAPGIRVLILTMFDLDEYVSDALRAGAAGFLLKTTPPRELLAAVKACAAGETTLGPSVIARLVDQYINRPREPVAALAHLTAREVDVLKAMALGLSNSEIGRELYLAETTVKTHVARILGKLGVRDRVQAVVIAHRSGLAAQ